MSIINKLKRLITKQHNFPVSTIDDKDIEISRLKSEIKNLQNTIKLLNEVIYGDLLENGQDKI